MEQYISKDALAREMESLRCSTFTDFGEGFNAAVQTILKVIDTLEVKEVDLEKHLKEDIEDVYFDLNGVAVKGATYYLTVEDIKEIAKHFFELGLKAAQKGE